MKSIGMRILCGVVVACGVVAPAFADAPASSASDAPAEPTRTSRAAEGTAPGACDASLLTGPATIAPHWSKYDYPTSVAEGASYYIIKRGDTLWDLSACFLGSPYLWPQIWDQNRYIKDAHWIYPGDPLLIPRVQLVSDAVQTDTGIPMGDQPFISSTPQDVLIPAIEEQALLCADTVVETSEDLSLYIIGSENGATKHAFAERDIMYLSKGSNAGVKPGDLYTIRHEVYDVKHPDTKRKIGRKVETAGVLRVLLVQENSATAIIEQSCREIHAGDYVVAYERPSVPLIVKRAPADRLTPPTGKMNGAVVDIADDRMIAGEGHVLTLNVGTRNGITPGNILTVYRVMYPTVPTSRVVLGEVAVVAVKDKTSTARVTYSADAILPGDRVELR